MGERKELLRFCKDCKHIGGTYFSSEKSYCLDFAVCLKSEKIINLVSGEEEHISCAIEREINEELLHQIGRCGENGEYWEPKEDGNKNKD